MIIIINKQKKQTIFPHFSLLTFHPFLQSEKQQLSDLIKKKMKIAFTQSSTEKQQFSFFLSYFFLEITAN